MCTVISRPSEGVYLNYSVSNTHRQGFKQDFELGEGGKQDGSRMIVSCESTLTHA